MALFYEEVLDNYETLSLCSCYYCYLLVSSIYLSAAIRGSPD
jgi:hypothetical protein